MWRDKINKLSKYENELIKLVKEKHWGESTKIIFRGQSNAKWALDSSADRRLKNENNPPDLIEYLTKVLIEPAKEDKFDFQQNGKLNDLELLAALQHQGAATCLIDFTTNFHIALWFACQDNKKNGKVFAMNSGDVLNFKLVKSEQANGKIEKLLEPTIFKNTLNEQTSPSLFYWKPPPNENRIVVQHSCFVFSTETPNSSLYVELEIDRSDKEEIKQLLEKYYGLDSQSIFRDFTGFAASQGHNQPLPTTFENANERFNSGKELFQEGKYLDAKKYYDEAIRLNPNYIEAFYSRGICKIILKDYEEALKDFDEAIHLDPNYAEAYNSRGNVKAQLGRHKESLEDYNKAVNLNPQNANIYYSRGNAKAQLEKHKEAIEDFDKAIKINPQSALTYYSRGKSKAELGQINEAIADLEHAKKLAQKQGFTQVLEWIEELLAKLKRQK